MVQSRVAISSVSGEPTSPVRLFAPHAWLQSECRFGQRFSLRLPPGLALHYANSRRAQTTNRRSNQPCVSPQNLGRDLGCRCSSNRKGNRYEHKTTLLFVITCTFFLSSVHAQKKEYAPPSKHPTQVYFGDPHIHTSISADAAMWGNA